MNDKKFTLIELIVVIAILGILASLIVPNISSFKGDATVTAIASNVRNFQTSVDMYSLKNNGQYPTANQPTEFIPQAIDFSKLDKTYLKTLPKTDGVKYWVDFQGRVWASTVDAPQKVVNTGGTITWEAVTGAVKYQIFEVEGYGEVIGTLAPSKANLVLKGETTSTTYTGEANKYYVVNAIDEQNFQTAPAGLNYKGYAAATPPAGGNEIPVLENHKPVATITMSQEQGLLTTTNIIFNYTFTDEDSDTISQVEWQVDTNPVQTTAPNGFLTEGNHAVKIRLQDSKGMWSDWAERQIFVMNLNGIKEIETGDSYTLVIKEDNSLWGFGNNRYGQLGTTINNGTSTAISTPIKIMDNVKKVSAGASHTLVIKTDDSLWGFGLNQHGQLGTTTNSGKNTANPTPIKIMDNVKQIATGASHTLVIKTDNSLWSFGTNIYGQLGVLTNNDTTNPNPTPIKIMDNIKQVEAGYYHSLVIKNDNTLWGFGVNQYGQLGNTTNNSSINSNPTPTKIMDDAIQVKAGASHTLVIKADNSLWSFGLNHYGQLGNTTNNGSSNTIPNPIPTKMMDNVLDVSVGDYHDLIIKTDKTLWTNGYNKYGQLGIQTNYNTTNPNPTPMKIMDNVVKVSAGSNHSIVMTSDKTVYSFGYNNYGQLGNSTTTSQYTPINISATY